MQASSAVPSISPLGSVQILPFALHSAIAKASHQNADAKSETGKRNERTDSQTPQSVNVAPDANAALAVAASTSGPSLTAQGTDQQATEDTRDAGPANPTVAASLNLAFAVRVAPATGSEVTTQPPKESSTNGTADTSEPVTRSVPSVVGGAQVVSALQQREPGSSSKDTDEYSGGGEQQPPVSLPQSHSAAHPSAAPARADFDSELKQASGSGGGAHIQLVGSGNQRVDIRLLERGGGLAVSVRSSDTVLTRTLQDHIPELTARLESEHLRSEAWTPSAGNSSGARDAKSGGSFSGQGDSFTGGGGQRRQHEGDKPKWVQELEDTSCASRVRNDEPNQNRKANP
jgi:hypothetical protein